MPADQVSKGAPKLVKAVVAPRRTIVIEHPEYKRGKPCPPGTMVDLPRGEVERLRALGYLVDPAAPEVEVQDGSSVHIEP